MDLKIFTNNIEGRALNQIYTLMKLDAFAGCKVRIMPDVHSGKGCVIGFTANLGDKVIPSVVGVDIGCGMLTVKLGVIDIDLKELDEVIHNIVPAGMNVHNETSEIVMQYINELLCRDKLHGLDHLYRSLGTLGGGNHFVEVDQDSEGCKYLIIHTGSRNLGAQVAKIYQELAIDKINGKARYLKRTKEIISKLKEQGRQVEIGPALKKLKEEEFEKIPNELCYLVGQDRENYLHDMKICQDFAEHNRNTIAMNICKAMGFNIVEIFQTVHNYISFEDNIVRKGAISAYKGQKVLIPMNMRDGCIIAIGKGNDDWNQSAPHGAGRLMSRGKAKENLKLEDFKETMKGIYSTTVNQSTIDEAPAAYKPMQEIIDNIGDTVDIIDIIKPIYNFKASE